MPNKIKRPTSFHWGSYYAETQDDNLVALKPYEHDTDPSSIANGLVDSVHDSLRIKFPHVRRGYLREIRRELRNAENFKENSETIWRNLEKFEEI